MEIVCLFMSIFPGFDGKHGKDPMGYPELEEMLFFQSLAVDNGWAWFEPCKEHL